MRHTYHVISRVVIASLAGAVAAGWAAWRWQDALSVVLGP